MEQIPSPDNLEIMRLAVEDCMNKERDIMDEIKKLIQEATDKEEAYRLIVEQYDAKLEQARKQTTEAMDLWLAPVMAVVDEEKRK